MHDSRHFTINPLLLYGKEEISIKSSSVSGTFSQYRLEPFEMNHISIKTQPCIYEKNKLMDLWECMTDYIYSKINCTLPWTKEAKNKGVSLCSSPGEYDQFSTEMQNAFIRKSDYIEKTAKCIPGCKRTEYSAKLVYNGKDKTTRPDEFKLKLFFARDMFPVKNQFYIYSTSHLIADFGGYLGLLLGYSILGFYDSLMDLMEYIIKIYTAYFSQSLGRF